MAQLPEAILKSAAAGRLVPFVGAGVSKCVITTQGTPAYPNWAELLKHGARTLQADGKLDVAAFVSQGIEMLNNPTVKGPSPVDLAGMIQANLSLQAWSRLLQDALDPSYNAIDNTSLELARAVWTLANNFVITTNFDRVLSWASGHPADIRILDLDDCSGLVDVMSGAAPMRPTVWHLHGHIDNPAKLIITADGYAKLYSAMGASSAGLMTLRSIVAYRSLLFVGFSFADPYVTDQLRSTFKLFDGYTAEHYALVAEADMALASKVLADTGVRALTFQHFGPPLVDLLLSIAEVCPGTQARRIPSASSAKAQEVSLAEAVAPSPKPQPVSVAERWHATRAVHLLDHLGPTYILDRNYFFMDWNPAFDMLFAEPLGLYRGEHAQDFVNALANGADVDARARCVFDPSNLPLVDMEPLFFKSGPFGLIELRKMASQILDDNGHLAGWVVTLNIEQAEKREDLWNAIVRALTDRVNWAMYAASYDQLLLKFDAYQALVSQVCSKLGDAVRCADLGAGTGNGTLTLLGSRADRVVWAIESNEEMLARLRQKISAATQNVNLVKQGLMSLGEFEDGFFDGAIMINVLYAVSDPATCLKEIARVLAPGGILAMSTPHSETDVDRLLAAIDANLSEKGLLPGLQITLNDVRRRHQAMMANIHRYTKNELRSYLEGAGFVIDEWLDEQYASAVVVIKAVKRA